MMLTQQVSTIMQRMGDTMQPTTPPPPARIQVGIIKGKSPAGKRQFTDVPGDGNCYWHCLVLILQRLNRVSAQTQWSDVKCQILQFMHNEAAHCTHIDGCPIEQWQQHARDQDANGVYVDTSTVLAASMFYHINQAIVGPQGTEFISLLADPNEAPVVWLTLRDQHYTVCTHADPKPNVALLQKAQEYRAESGLLDLTGGGGPHQAQHSWDRLGPWDSHHGVCSGAPHSTDAALSAIASYNIGGGQKRLPLAVSIGTDIVALQETYLTGSAVTAVRRELNTDAWNILPGKESVLIQQSNGVFRPDRAACPGVAIAHRADLEVKAIPCCTPAATAWYEAGRLQIASVRGRSFTLILINCYSFSGYNAEAVASRDTFLHDLAAEIAARPSQPMVLCGDMNVDWRTHPLSAYLTALGWILPAYIDEEGRPTDTTYSSGGSSSCIDLVACSGEVPSAPWTVSVANPFNTQHFVLTMQVPFAAAQCEPQLRLPKPTHWGDPLPNAASPVDWKALHLQVRHLLSDQAEDKAFEAFSNALYRHLLATTSTPVLADPPLSHPRLKHALCQSTLTEGEPMPAQRSLCRCIRALRKYGGLMS
eukprot:499006-Amphidinium_carterae.4